MGKYSFLRGAVGFRETGFSVFKGSLILFPSFSVIIIYNKYSYNKYNKGFSVILEHCVDIRASDYFD